LANTKRNKVHIAVLSGGITSSYAAYNMVNKYGIENCRLFLLDSFSESVSDPNFANNYRFMEEVAEYIGLPLIRVERNDSEEVYYDFCHHDDDAPVFRYQVESKMRQMVYYLEEIRNNEKLEPILHFGNAPEEMYNNKSICLESVEKEFAKVPDIRDFFEQVPVESIETHFPLFEIEDKEIDIKGIIQNEWDIELPRSEQRRVHIAMFSGGAGSAYVAYYMVQAFGKENCKLFFTNTLWEDEDNLRFMDEISEYIGLEITEILDGRTPEEVFYDFKFLGNSRLAKCSEELKVRQTLIFLEELRDNEKIEPVLYFGIAPHEKRRRDDSHVKRRANSIEENSPDMNIRKAAGLRSFYEHFPLEPIETRFPLIETLREDIDAKGIIQNEWGIKLPRMYTAAIDKAEKENDPIAKKLVKYGINGFSHANCGGRCVRGGFQHYATLYAIWPDQYKEQEEMEERFRKHFEKDVSILKKNGGAYTLKQFRDDIEKEGIEKYLFKPDDTIPCVCSFS
jgi:3'-phosphoadenosine 5'-phosphosulfate sulfotransferase (PAPS reductase)/FAD synthetase